MNQIIIFCAKYLFIASGLIALWVLTHESKLNRKTLMLRGIIVLLVGVALAKIGGALYIEQRPFVALHIAPLIPHNAENGFPSDHALVTFGIAFLLMPFSLPAGLIALIVATAVSIGRVESYLHTPLDIYASIFFAAVASVLASKIVRTDRRNAKSIAEPVS